MRQIGIAFSLLTSHFSLCTSQFSTLNSQLNMILPPSLRRPIVSLMSASEPNPAIFRGHIGQRIRYYRQRLGLNQTELAKRAKVNQGFLSEIERGRRKPSPSSLQALSVVLD